MCEGREQSRSHDGEHHLFNTRQQVAMKAELDLAVLISERLRCHLVSGRKTNTPHKKNPAAMEVMKYTQRQLKSTTM